MKKNEIEYIEHLRDIVANFLGKSIVLEFDKNYKIEGLKEPDYTCYKDNSKHSFS